MVTCSSFKKLFSVSLWLCLWQLKRSSQTPQFQTKVIKKCWLCSALRGSKMHHYFWKDDRGGKTAFFFFLVRCFNSLVTLQVSLAPLEIPKALQQICKNIFQIWVNFLIMLSAFTSWFHDPLFSLASNCGLMWTWKWQDTGLITSTIQILAFETNEMILWPSISIWANRVYIYVWYYISFSLLLFNLSLAAM